MTAGYYKQYTKDHQPYGTCILSSLVYPYCILNSSTHLLACRAVSRLIHSQILTSFPIFSQRHTIQTHINGNYPCLCLCFGFSQITLTLPFLLMILHFSQIGFTDDLTFMSNPPSILLLYHTLRANFGHTSPETAISYCNTIVLAKSIVFLLISPNNSSLAQVIWRHFQRHFVTW